MRLVRLLVALCALLAAPAAQAEVRVRIAATDPASTATLGRDQTFYVRIQFDADEPTHIWARPYLAGQPVKRIRFNPSAQHIGTGEALGWFELSAPGEVDEVRIIVGGGKPYREREAAVYPVRLTWTDATAAAAARAPWVDEMRRELQAAYQQAAREAASRPPGAGDYLIMTVFPVLVVALLLGSVAGPAVAAWKWRGGWRLAAIAPLAVMGFVVLRIVVDVARNPKSHNLWPFEILIWGAGCVAAIAALAALRWLSVRRAA